MATILVRVLPARREGQSTYVRFAGELPAGFEGFAEPGMGNPEARYVEGEERARAAVRWLRERGCEVAAERNGVRRTAALLKAC